MGMEVRVVIAGGGEVEARRAAEAAFATVAALDARLSDYRQDSDIRAIARAAPASARVAPDVVEVLRGAIGVARDSSGAFDPTVAPLTELWRASRATGRLPPADAVSAARELVGWPRIELEAKSSSVRLPQAGMRLDLGGIAKGYILQRALETLRAHGAARAMVEAGGDVVAGMPPPGRPGWAVAAGCVPGPGGGRRGGQASAETAVLWLRDEALATSGADAQFVEVDGVRYAHVIDPRTGFGVIGQRTVHVRAPDGTTADGWATALGVLGPEGAPGVTLPEGVTYCFAGPRVPSSGAAARRDPP